MKGVRIFLKGDSFPLVSWYAIVGFFEGQVVLTREPDDFSILCEFVPAPYRSGSAYGPVQYKQEKIWKIVINVSDDAQTFPNGNKAALYTYEAIIIHELLHEFWYVAGLGDIHDRNFGVRDNVQVYQILKQKVGSMGLASLFKKPRANSSGAKVHAMKIILEAGHSKKFPGMVGIIKENDKVREIVRIAQKVLAAEGFEVLIVPDDLGGDSANDNLVRKIEWINQHAGKKDFLISVHCNAFSSPEAVGTEVWYFGGSDYSKQIAVQYADLLSQITESPNRGVFPDTSSRLGRLGIIRSTKPIALLSENGFVTNPQDAAKPAGLYAEAIHRFIHSFTGKTHVDQPDIPSVPDLHWEDKYKNLKSEIQRVLHEL